MDWASQASPQLVDGMIVALKGSTDRTQVYEALAVQLRQKFRDPQERITELQLANNAMVLAHRDRAERLAQTIERLAAAEAELAQYKGNPA